MRTKVSYCTDGKKFAKEAKKLDPVVAEIMYNRGFKSEEDMAIFLEGILMHDPSLMKGVDRGAKIIVTAIKKEIPIVVYSDSDMDGVMSAVVGMKLLKLLTDKVHYYTNNKHIDGYGLCIAGVDNILNEYPDAKLILTADNGIAANEGIAYARKKGLAVVVTDHHEPQAVLPSANAIIDPKQLDCQYPFDGICGATVLYKVLEKVHEIMGTAKEKVEQALPFCALATVGDVVPLVDENRTIVKKGLEMLETNPSHAFQLMKSEGIISGFEAHNDVAYRIVPMINALGRMDGNMMQAIELFLTDNPKKIKLILRNLVNINEERKTLTKENVELAVQLLEEKTGITKDKKEAFVKALPNVLLLYNKGFSEGVVGIVAGKLKEDYERPVIVLTDAQDEGKIKGSARSVDGFHLKDVLEAIHLEHGILPEFGGHEKAAGLTLLKDDLPIFEKALIEKAIQQKIETKPAEIALDASIEAKDLSVKKIEALYQILSPFGEGFKEPLVGLNYIPDKTFYMGENRQHVKVVDRCNQISVIMWNGTDIYNQVKHPKGKAVGRFQINEYNNKKSLQMIVEGQIMA